MKCWGHAVVQLGLNASYCEFLCLRRVTRLIYLTGMDRKKYERRRNEESSADPDVRMPVYANEKE